MSLVQQCLESFGTIGPDDFNLSPTEASKYTMEEGSFLIDMESTIAISELYDLEYELESELVRGVSQAKSLGVPVEEGLGSAISGAADKIKNIWHKVIEWFKKLKVSLYNWFENVKKTIRGMFAKPKELVMDVKDVAKNAEVQVTNESITISTRSSSNSNKPNSSPKPAMPSNNTSPRSNNNSSTPNASSSSSTGSSSSAPKSSTSGKSVTIPVFKVYRYSNTAEFPRMLGDATNAIADVISGKLLKTYQDYSNLLYKNELNHRSTSDSNKIVKSFNNELTKEAGHIKDIIKRFFGTDDLSNASSVAFSYFRNGAKGDEDKVTADQKMIDDIKKSIADGTVAMKTENDRLNFQDFEKEVTSCQKSLVHNIDVVINAIENVAKNKNQNSRLTAAANTVVKYYNQFKSGVLTYTNAYVAACKEAFADIMKIVNALMRLK